MKKLWLILLFIIMFMTGCSSSLENVFEAPNKYKSVLSITDADLLAEVSEYTIYGKYFNLSGKINYTDQFDEIHLVLKSKDNEIVYPLIYEKEESSLSFKTNEKITEGINLERVSFDNYVILIRIIKDGKINYYNLIDASENEALEYYTITEKNQNDYINIVFSKYDGFDFMKMEMTGNVKKESLCDIVIDAGHGGSDPGAVNGKYSEKEFNLLYAKMLKQALEDLGLKVALTRDSDFLPATYGVGSRTGIPYECSAKLMLSLHLNSSSSYVGDGGVEIYMPNGASTDFPKILADNIVKNTTTTHSLNPSFKVFDGVYMRTYDKEDIASLKKDARDNKWTLYENVSTETTYYYFIRETGGIITGALTDGRNPEYPANPYYNSNHGIESYLVELGYISSAKNLQKIINEKEDYIKGLVESVKYYIAN